VSAVKRNLTERILGAAFGLLVCAAGSYLTITAGIGLSPWDALCMGISGRLPLSYGMASVLVSVCVLAADLLLGEPVGLGTLLDAAGVGTAVDALLALDLLPAPGSLAESLFLLALGIVTISVGQWIYMRSGLGCGPRDSLLVALGKRARRVPIGAVNLALLLAVVSGAWLLGGPIGIGTVVTVGLQGVAMQLVFRLVRFEPRSVAHEDLLHTARLLAVK
jgi:uncharacterized membrane protein YczE